MAKTLIKTQQSTTGNGWFPANETWTYASADDPTYTFTIAGVDLTTKYSAGMRIKLTQTTVKYFIITAVAFSTNTTITVYGGTDYDLVDAAISLNYYSTHKVPQGFPLDPVKWQVLTSSTTNRNTVTPTQNVWYNAESISIPIGSWMVSYVAALVYQDTEAGACYATLSTANNSESDTDLSTVNGMWWASAVTEFATYATVHCNPKNLVLAAKTSYYLNYRTTSASVGAIKIDGSVSKTFIRAVCAYL